MRILFTFRLELREDERKFPAAMYQVIREILISAPQKLILARQDNVLD